MKILIVEDEKEIREMLAQNLRKEKYIVDTASNGKEGLYLASVNSYRLIILDLNLPRLSGNCVCRELRNQRVDTPIIITTVATEIKDELALFNLGADDYIVKPFLFTKLLAHIRAVLRRPAKIEKEIIYVGDLTIEMRNFKVKRSGRDIKVTPKEFALIVYLARNQNRAISCEEIMENVWDMNINILSNVVKTHISNLRTKIDKGQKKQLIQTIKGKGYILRVDE